MIRQKAIIYFVPNGFYYFQDQFTAVLSVAFPKEVFSDLEIKDEVQFSSFIESFIASYKLSASSYILMLSPWLVFEKDILAPSYPLENKSSSDPIEATLEENVQHFLSLVPFEHVVSRVFPIPQGGRVVAINQDIVDRVAKSFSHIGSELAGVVPYFALSGLSSETAGFPLEYALSALGEFESLKQFAIAPHAVPKTAPKETGVNSELKTPQKKSNRRLVVLTAIFVTLIGVLIAVYFTMGVSQPAPTMNTVVIPSIARQQSMASDITPTASVSASPVLLSRVAVAVYGQEDQAIQMASIAAFLQAMGTGSITETIATVSPSKTTVLFGKGVSSQERNVLLEKLSEILSSVITAEAETQDSTVRIVLGK